jgi:hypothetical protein
MDGKCFHVCAQLEDNPEDIEKELELQTQRNRLGCSSNTHSGGEKEHE